MSQLSRPETPSLQAEESTDQASLRAFEDLVLAKLASRDATEVVEGFKLIERGKLDSERIMKGTLLAWCDNIASVDYGLIAAFYPICQSFGKKAADFLLETIEVSTRDRLLSAMGLALYMLEKPPFFDEQHRATLLSLAAVLKTFKNWSIAQEAIYLEEDILNPP